MHQSRFFGRHVVAATFLMAVFGWGIGFYGPPIFMYAVIQRTGWSPALCATAVTVHFLAGTLIVINLPALYRRIGLPWTTVSGAVILAVGVFGWSIALQPWHLFIAAMLSGFGWVTMGAAAVNATISPWFISKRPGALAMAYNGASIGGVVFSSGWVYLIGRFGFSIAAIVVGVLSIAVIALLAFSVFRFRPEHLGQHPDGILQSAIDLPSFKDAAPIPLHSNRQFITLAAAMSLGLFAQIGLISQMFLLLVGHVTEQRAGLAMGIATASAIAGRSLSARLIPRSPYRRNVACLSYGCQLLGCLALLFISVNPAWLWAGMILFGLGIGNATSLPPLIAQAEFPRQQVARVVTLIVAIAQGCYAFAPAFFGAVRALFSGPHSEQLTLTLAAGIQGLAMLALISGLRTHQKAVKNRQKQSDRSVSIKE
ncbi:membrane protein [Pseudomonas syringae CC1557]|uniref:Membrane protein n=1 Tax=Pseudomonas syringae CC1557 TaxID=1357279 RepID=W0MXF0_PSESX|nr:MFS transporter [Pseudomonas syringae]AHG41880.1 membrane protein [Pseudomonas syringae CC1557]